MQNNKQIGLYFIALLPPRGFLEEVQLIKEDFAQRFQSKASLNSPPHITLHMPFKYQEQKEERIFDALKLVSEKNASLEIIQNGFGAFEPRVIFVNVALSPELRTLQKDVLSEIRKSCKIENSDYKNLGFHPHVTLAFRDLKKAKFEEAWSEFEHKPIQCRWKADSIVLLKHNGKKWDVYEMVFLTN